MNIDCLAQFISITKDTALTVAAVVGGYVALKGLSTWNRQLKGGVEYDLTRRILKCAYRLREAIKGVRNPVMWGNEMPTPPESEASKMSKEQVKHYGLANAYQKRWDKVTEVRTDLQTEMLEAEAIWGRVIYEKFEPIFKLQQELFSSVHAYVSVCNPNESEQSRAAYQGIMKKQRDILYDLTSENPDEFTQDINRAIEEIESFLKPHLRK
ncbi:MAG: hypothetical protein WC009_07730 [Methylotenera sp.]